MNRFTVKSVSKDHQNGIQIVELDSGQVLHLKQGWFYSLIEEGDRISYETSEPNKDSQQATPSASPLASTSALTSASPPASQPEQQPIITIDDSSANFMVLDPDRLVTSTDLSSVSFCLRKTWLGNRIKFYGDHNRATLLGTLIHCLFQDTIGDQNLTVELLENKFLGLVKDPYVIRSLVAMNLNEDELINDSKEYINSIVLFNQKFSTGKAEPFDQNQPNLKLKINRVTDIEETVLVPKYGLKGKIDATMDVEIHERSSVSRQIATPFELKTGKVSFSFSHQSQISLYAMMLDRPARSCKFGLLAYLKEGISMKYVTINDCIRNSLIRQRNELVHHLKYAKTGPDSRSNISFCPNCEHLLDCCLLGQAYAPEKLTSFYSANPDFVACVLSHLGERELTFFRRYIDMIYQEELHLKRNSQNAYFWNRSAVELERDRRAIAKLVLFRTESSTSGVYEYVFERAQQFKSLGGLPVDLAFSGSAERITMSIENEAQDVLDKIGFVSGVIKSLDENYLTVRLDDKINETLLDKLFRLDIAPALANCSFMYSSMLRLMCDDESGSANLRAYIIEQQAPTFKSTFTANELEIARRACSDLNDAQRKAVIRSLHMDNYLLIRGLPGTGKSEIIVRIAKILIELNKTVLICSHTNHALDYVLLRLLAQNVKFLRIGRPSRIHLDLIEHSEDRLVRSCSSMFGLKVKYLSYNLFAGNCHSMNGHLIFGLKKIDYCIVHEANQLSLTDSILPLFDCEKFILVGDPQQLRPTIKSDVARQAGLDEALFDLLFRQKTDNRWEDNSVSLTVQYRMNREIMRIANSCTYENQLTCSSDQVANSTLDLKMDTASNEAWMELCLSAELPVVFLDTDDCSTTGDHDGILSSQIEINILTKIVGQLVQCGYPVDRLGIIAFYAEQIRLLKSSISATVDISTIEQAKNKDTILISCVRSIKNVERAEPLNDNRRLNVAITRANKKLILVGNRQTLECYEPFQRLFSCLSDRQVIKV